VTDADRILAYDDRAPDPDATETATFALGCFWGPDATFGGTDGVVRTRVGYAGGTTPDPTYHDVGDHSEAVQVDYDPRVVSFDDLVDRAIAEHDPRTQPPKKQYQTVLFYDSTGERNAIEKRLADLSFDAETRVEPLEEFTGAETYHQKFNLRSERAIQAAFEDAGYDDADVRESPAAAKLNGGVTLADTPQPR
jgi:peptide-methionine (S)-S-oxide reductase